jgi:hypothetical protein
MVIMFAVFIIGWTPWVTLYIVLYYIVVTPLIAYAVYIWFQLALMLEMIDLFLYNHQVRKYLTKLCLASCRR